MSNDFTPASIRLFSEACSLYGVSDAARAEFASRIRRVVETTDRDGRRALDILLDPVENAKDQHVQICVSQDWKSRWTASLVYTQNATRPGLAEVVRREIPGLEGRSARICLTSLWAMYAQRLANGCAEVSVTFR
jgi:hypothetical protein